MIVGAPAKTLEGERRVALTPDSVGRIIGSGLEVPIETGAGLHAGFLDKEYAAERAAISADVSGLWQQANLVLKAQVPKLTEVALTAGGGALYANALDWYVGRVGAVQSPVRA